MTFITMGQRILAPRPKLGFVPAIVINVVDGRTSVIFCEGVDTWAGCLVWFYNEDLRPYLQVLEGGSESTITETTSMDGLFRLSKFTVLQGGKT